MKKEALAAVHGGFRNLKSFQVAQLVYDLTLRFCDRYWDGNNPLRQKLIDQR